MKLVFADTIYWVALINPNDQWHGPALSAQALFHDMRLVTTDVILLEVLNFFAEHGEEARFRAVSATEEILTNPDTEVVRHTHESFLAGLALYKARADKGYSLTDCISMTRCTIGTFGKYSLTIITSSRKTSPFSCSCRNYVPI